MTLVNRFNGYYDIHDGGKLIGRVMSHHDGWTARNVRRDLRPGPYAFTAPTRREAVAMLLEWIGGHR